MPVCSSAHCALCCLANVPVSTGVQVSDERSLSWLYHMRMLQGKRSTMVPSLSCHGTSQSRSQSWACKLSQTAQLTLLTGWMQETGVLRINSTTLHIPDLVYTVM